MGGLTDILTWERRHWLLPIAFAAFFLASACGSEKKPVAAQFQFSPAAVTGTAALAAKGERLSAVLGCKGCHDTNLTGGEWINEPAFAILYSNNLTHSVQRLSDLQLETILRTGKRPDGRDVYEMPSEAFAPLSAPDMKALLAYLRTLKPAGHEWPAMKLGPEGRAELANGKFKPTASWVEEEKGKAPVDLGPELGRGRYLSHLACGECHTPTLAGKDEPFRPDLMVVSAYSRAEFEELMRKGVAKGGRELPLMSSVARGRFAPLAPDEVDAIYAYLSARAAQPQ